MVEAQKYLDKNYPLEKRKEITDIDISNKDLQGDLVIDGFNKIERFNCSLNGG
jgi:hypothetical protein